MKNGGAKNSLKMKVYNSILEKVIRKEFPRDAILIEGELAAMFKVSKAPVREALVQLCSEDILQSIPRAGYRIVQLTEKDFRETVELREILELGGLRKIGSVDKKFIDTLKELEEKGRWVARGEKNVALDTWWKSNVAFHIALNSLAGNSRLTEALENSFRLQWRVIAQLYWDTDPMRYLSLESSSHSIIIEALLERDLEKAEKALTEDLGAIPRRMPPFWNEDNHGRI